MNPDHHFVGWIRRRVNGLWQRWEAIVSAPSEKEAWDQLLAVPRTSERDMIVLAAGEHPGKVLVGEATKKQGKPKRSREGR